LAIGSELAVKFGFIVLPISQRIVAIPHSVSTVFDDRCRKLIWRKNNDFEALLEPQEIAWIKNRFTPCITALVIRAEDIATICIVR